MTGAVFQRTPTVGLGLIEFNFPNWADDANLNMQIIDAALSTIGVTIKGAWTNNTPYDAGDLVVDPGANTLWRAQSTHVSNDTGTFAQERAAHPDLWVSAQAALHARGQWTQNTAYFTNDIVYLGYVWALVAHQYTSSLDFNTDIAAGHLVVITDNTASVTSSGNNASQAQISATTASNAATASAASQTAAAISASAAASSETVATAKANASANSAISADTDADRAEAALAAMQPDPAADSKYYGRFNHTWQLVPGEAPTDGRNYVRNNAAWSAFPLNVIISDAVPSGTFVPGQFWWESDTGNMFMWYTDADSSQWIQVSGFTSSQAGGGGGGGISEAPIDGKIYARQNSAWREVSSTGGVPEAPADGKYYVRKDNAWVEVPAPAPQPMTYDVNGDAIIKFSGTTMVRIKPTGLVLTKNDVEVFSISV